MTLASLNPAEPQTVHRSRCAVWDDEPCDCDAWRALASCAQMTPAESDRIFFGNTSTAINEAVAICAECPVRRECSTYVDKVEPDYRSHLFGVWAGETPRLREQRRKGSA